ncbi:hypothetical protein [Pseudooceanicola algae]|nr:hypothetical protein [Pseudooceanicola algae]
MVARLFLRKGVNYGLDRFGGDSPQDRKRLAQTKKMSRQMRQTQRLLRRMGRF